MLFENIPYSNRDYFYTTLFTRDFARIPCFIFHAANTPPRYR